MKKQKQQAIIFWVVAAFLALCIPFIYADTITSTQSFGLSFDIGGSFAIQSLNPSAVLTFTVDSGALNGSGSLSVNSVGGSLVVAPNSLGAMKIVSNNATVLVYVNTFLYSVPFNYSNGISFTVTWLYAGVAPTPSPSTPNWGVGINTDFLWAALMSYDFVGFIIGCWTYSLAQTFYVLCLLIVGGLFYIKTHSLLYVSIIWIIFGSLVIGLVGVAMTSPIIYFLVAFAIATSLYKLFQHST